MFDNVGIGPHKDAVAHRVYIDNYRGFSTTDQDKIHPDLAYKKFKYSLRIDAHIAAGLLPRPTDGLYYRRYVYNQSRQTKAAKRKKIKSEEDRPVVWKPRAARFKKSKTSNSETSNSKTSDSKISWSTTSKSSLSE